MKLFITLLLVAVASAGRLENTYLPPNNARLAGGNGLTAPSIGLSSPLPPSTLYGTPVASSRFVSPVAPTYGVPLPAVKTYLAPVTPPVPILKLNNDNNGDGSYRYDYETANHIAAQESGQLTSAGINAVRGSFSYLAPSGETITVNYIADEHGFRPEGSHLPTPPPIPEAILKSLQINAAEEAKVGTYQGQAAVPSISNEYLPPAVVARQGGYRY